MYYWCHTRAECQDHVDIKYDLPGCNPACRHASIEVRDSTRTCRICGREQSWHEVSPNCARLADWQARRAEIFARAQTASDALMPVNWRRAHKAWEGIVSEFNAQPCPFCDPPTTGSNCTPPSPS